MIRYQHTQPGTLTIVAMTAGMCVCAFAAGLAGKMVWVPLATDLVLAFCLVMFHSLTVEIDDEHVHLQFARGPFRWRFSLGAVESCEAVRNRWYYGWGVRWCGGWWLYNVSGLDAVEMRMKGGRRVRIGTDEPERLVEAIRAAIAERRKT